MAHFQNGSFAIVDFAVQLEKSETGPELSKVLEWLKGRCSYTEEQIESYCKAILTGQSPAENEQIFLQKWKATNADNPDPDVLALRVLETTLLLKLAHCSCLHAQSLQEESQFSSSQDCLSFDELIDLSEGIGLLRALQPTFHADDTLMDIDLDEDLASNTTSLSTSSSSGDSQNRSSRTEFEKYLLERFTHLPRIKEIIELVAERCGFPFDSDDEFEFNQRGRDRSIFNSEASSTNASPVHVSAMLRVEFVVE